MLHKIIFVNNGQNLKTEKTPFKEYNEETDGELLNEKKMYCLTFDDNRLVEDNRYELREIQLPDWMTGYEYCHNHVKGGVSICIYMQFYPYLVKKLGRNSFKLGFLPQEKKEALNKLCKTKKFRSEFRKSLFEQVKNWVEVENPEYSSPLSPRQWSSIMRY